MVISDPQHIECANLVEARWGSNICNHENNVPSQLSTKWFCGNSCTWAHDVTVQLPKSCCGEVLNTKKCSIPLINYIIYGKEI